MDKFGRNNLKFNFNRPNDIFQNKRNVSEILRYLESEKVINETPKPLIELVEFKEKPQPQETESNFDFHDIYTEIAEEQVIEKKEEILRPPPILKREPSMKLVVEQVILNMKKSKINGWKT